MPAARTSIRQRDRRSNDPDYDTLINDTLQRVRTGELASFNEAARQTGIPRSTLTDRAKKRHLDWKTSTVKRQLLTPEQEQTLLSWAGHRASMGLPFSPADLRNEASAISGKDVGRNWHKKFAQRHPELQAARPAKLDPKRAKNFNEAVINDYFDKMEMLHARFPGGIPPEHIWNMDEKGIQMGGGRKRSNKKYYFLKSQKQRYQLRSDNLELVTILECISAAGDIVPPSFCLQNGGIPDLRHKLDAKEWGSIYFSESGWTDTYNCERWLEEVFIPFAKKKRIDSSKPIVLTMDGHDTHEKPELQRIVYKFLDQENLEIVIFCFPSKCTHKCQPLDVVVFSSVERKWQDVCERCVKNKTPINRFTVIPEYIRGTREAMTKELIAKAFEKTGIYPVKREVFTQEDFAPSKASSSIAHVPDDFPVDFPSSDPPEIDPDYEASVCDSDASLDSKNCEEPILSDGHSDESDESDDESDTDTAREEELEPEAGSLDQETQQEHVPPTSGLMHYLANIETGIIHMTRSANARLDLFTAKPPQCVSEVEDRHRNYEELFNEVRSLRDQLWTTHEALGRALGQLSAANAHCTSIHRELGSVRQELETVTKKKQPRSTKKIKARFLTSEALREEFEREDAERLEREKVNAEKDKQKEVDSAQRALRVADDALNRVFVGRIASYKKDDLKALALSLALSDKGTNPELSSRIQDYFDAHPDLKKNTRFLGLFQPGRRRNNAQGSGEDANNDGQEQGDENGEPGENPDQINAQPHLIEGAPASYPPNAQFLNHPHPNNYNYPYYQNLYHGLGQPIYNFPGYIHTNFNSTTAADTGIGLNNYFHPT